MASSPSPNAGSLDTFVAPAEKHIRVAYQEILALFKTSMNVGQKQKYEEVCELIESLYAQEFMTLRRSIKHNFLPFSTGAKSQQLVTRKGRSLPPKADLDHREVKLIEDFLQLMASGRYTLMTQKEWEVATAEQFMFYLPVEVNWDYFDATMLPRFWASSPERRALRAKLPDLADRVLLLHRDIGLAQDSGLYINQKIDLLVQYLVVWPLMKLWTWLMVLMARWVTPLLRRLRGKSQQLAPGASTNTNGTTTNGATTNGTAPSPWAVPNSASEDREPQLPQHRATRIVERRTLRRLLPTAWTVITNMHRKLHLQEPMYKEVVVMYRTSGQQRAGSRKKAPARTLSNEERLAGILARRNVHIKCFHDIPLADMEVIFPDKKVYIKTLSLINLLVQSITTFVAAIASLWKMGALDLKAVTSALSMVAARCGSLYSSMQAERSTMIQEMVNILYDKTNDAQEGVLSMLLEDMAEQQCKEAVLAYTLLFQRLGDELTQEELDDLCERFLDDNFDLQMDFAVEDALPRLLKWGMVQYNAKNNRYQAVPLDAAHASLYREWGKAYEALSKPPVTQQLPLQALLPATEQLQPAGASLAMSDSEPACVVKKKGLRSGLSTAMMSTLFNRRGSSRAQK